MTDFEKLWNDSPESKKKIDFFLIIWKNGEFQNKFATFKKKKLKKTLVPGLNSFFYAKRNLYNKFYAFVTIRDKFTVSSGYRLDYFGNTELKNKNGIFYFLCIKSGKNNISII